MRGYADSSSRNALHPAGDPRVDPNSHNCEAGKSVPVLTTRDGPYRRHRPGAIKAVTKGEKA